MAPLQQFHNDDPAGHVADSFRPQFYPVEELQSSWVPELLLPEMLYSPEQLLCLAPALLLPELLAVGPGLVGAT